MSFQIAFETRYGAEARIKLVEWRDRPAISKKRLPKPYRAEALDVKLRSRRTKQESELLHHAKLAGVATPEVYFADPVSSEIIMEYLDGILLKDVTDQKRAMKIYRTLGEYAARLHSNNIIHGDMTPKNVIEARNKTVVIDFGLAFISSRLEDRAEDLHLLKQAIKSSEKTSPRAFESVMAGYASVSGKNESSGLRKKIAEIERRGRYARVD